MIEQMISAVPMVGPVATQMSAYAAPVVDSVKALFKPLVALGAVLLVGACADPSVEKGEARPTLATIARVPNGGEVSKICDEGRVIYVMKSGYGGGIAVVENAAECPQPKKTDAKGN